MILVCVGTHHQPFDRLVRAAADLACIERVVVQRGTSLVAPAGCEIHDVVAPDVFAGWLSEARIVVCHAGSGTIAETGAAGHVPIVVPRRRLWREHVDDHQLHWARHIADRVHLVEDPSRLIEAVEGHDAHVDSLPRPWLPGVNPAWLAALESLER